MKDLKNSHPGEQPVKLEPLILKIQKVLGSFSWKCFKFNKL